MKGNIEGNKICYCINEKAIDKFARSFTNISTEIAEKNLVLMKADIYSVGVFLTLQKQPGQKRKSKSSSGWSDNRSRTFAQN